MIFNPKIETVGSISEFLNPVEKEETLFNSIVAHIEENQLIYKSVGLSLFLTFGIGYEVFADGYTNGIIDREANVLYQDLVDVGKWLIIGKGGWEVISSVLKSDTETAKKKFIGYVIAYASLLAMPHIFNKVDAIFTRMGDV